MVKRNDRISKNREDTLKTLDREDLGALFEGYKPRVAHNRRKTAPMDQRVSISVTEKEKVALDSEITSIKKSGGKISISQFIRNRALSSVDLERWRELAEVLLDEVETIHENRGKLRSKRRDLELSLEDDMTEEDVIVCEDKINEINRKLDRIIATNERRKYRLSGRLTMVESETVKWRAQRLCLTTSDFLRILIFDLEPGGSADAHLSYDAKRRFYISIMDVQAHGWGNPPKVYQCSNCETVEEENERLRSRIAMLEDKLVQDI